MLPFLEPILFPFIKQICFRGSQIDNLWAAVSVFFLDGAFLAVVGVRYSRAATNDTPALVRSVVALVADPDQSAGTNVGVADDASAVALFTQASDGHASLKYLDFRIFVMKS